MPERDHATVAGPAPTTAATRQCGERSRTPADLALSLQRTAGNAAVAQVLARLVNPGARTSATEQDDTALAWRRHSGDVAIRAAGEDASGIAADDVIQGQLGDCYFLSPLQATARINPGRIRRLIRGPVETRDDGTRIFEVTLYERHTIGSPSERKFRVTDKFVTEGSGESRYAQPGDIGVNGPEIWVMLLEKAWAGMLGGYDEAHGGLMRDGMVAVTGYDTDSSSIGSDEDEIFDEISTCVRDGKPVTIQTKQEFSSEEMDAMMSFDRTIFAQHAYNVAGVSARHRTLDIVNPHGRNHLPDFPVSRLREFFDSYVMSEESVR